MLRFASAAFHLVFLAGIAGCGGATFRWHPSLVSQVPDSTPVRFGVQRNTRRVLGRALDWQHGRPRVITARGDTVVVPDTATLEVRLKNKANRAVAGAVVGYIVGVGVSYGLCPPPKTTCGEQDPTPVWSAGLGALIGSAFKKDHWVRVRWDRQ